MGSLGSDHENLVHQVKSLDVVQVSSLCASTPVFSTSTCCLHVDMYRASATSDFQLNLASRSLGGDGKEEKAKLGYFSPWLPLHKVLHWLCPLTEGHCPSQGRMLSSSGPDTPFLYSSSWSLGWLQFALVIYLSANNLPPKLNALHTFICPGFCGGSNPSAH